MKPAARRPFATAAVALGLFTACGEEPPEPPAPTPVDYGRRIDVLFVVDNSASMLEEQGRLTAAFPAFTAALAGAPGGMPDVHIGVISSTVGLSQPINNCASSSGGHLQNVSPTGRACAGPTGRFISDEAAADGSRTRNYSGALEETFSCIASLGDRGCGFEQHLEAMRLALSPATAVNAGFLRDNARLAIIIVADEDDCSAADQGLFDPNDTSLTGTLGPLSSFRCTEFGITCAEGTVAREEGSYTGCQPRSDSRVRHPQEYVDFVKGLKPDASAVFVAGIIGDPDKVAVGLNEQAQLLLSPSCTTAENGAAAPGVRLAWFLDAFGANGSSSTICSGDFGPALSAVAAQLVAAIGE